MKISLGNISDPSIPVNETHSYKASQIIIKKMYKELVLIRRVEQTIATMVQNGEVNCPCHFAIGQEAPAVGIGQSLRPSDRVFSAHRGHAHYLASGGDVEGLFAEVMGKSGGSSRGMGGSMHLYGKGTSFSGSVPIVGGTVPVAVGAAMASKFDRSGDIAVAYFGDGACEEGVVHESLNFASVMKLPVVFVVENNLYSSHLDINYRQPGDRTARFADANCIDSYVVDGNNTLEIYSLSKKIIQKARKFNRPAFIEAVTFRWLGHVGPDENIVVGVRRSKKEISLWKERDPINKIKKYMLSNGFIIDQIIKIENEVDNLISKSLKKARKQPVPKKDVLIKYVYS